jgi:hypothetical protein
MNQVSHYLNYQVFLATIEGVVGVGKEGKKEVM